MRRIVQIVVSHDEARMQDNLYALAQDGSLWTLRASDDSADRRGGWVRLPELPPVFPFPVEPAA